ncbi:MAG: serine/threonine protein kinase [Myxococcota bacterium]|nr:serine/threonine protein kinase [Myxococcota bacterium]
MFLGRAVTIKIPHERIVNDAIQLEQFRREAISLAGIHSPNVVGIYDLGLTNAGAYVVMQHIEGRTVEEEIRRFGPMPERRAAGVLAQLVAGLAAMHAKGLVHGDIRSSNVLLARNGKVVLLDLGIVLDARRASTVVGSGIPGDRRTPSRPTFTCDVYHVGLLVLFMLTGVDPARRSPRSGFEDLFRRLPEQFVELARRALDTDSAQRFSSAASMKVAVEMALAIEPTASAAGP